MDRERRVAVVCGSDSQRGSIAPFFDMAELTRQHDGENQPFAPGIEVVALYDAALPASPFETARPTRFLKAAPAYDAIVLPAGYDVLPELPEPSPALCEWLRWHHGRGAWLCGLATGVVALAATGLLDGRRAAVSPRHAALVRARFPGIILAHVAGMAEDNRILTASEAASVFPLVTMLAGRIHSGLLAERYRRASGIREIRSPGANLFPIRVNEDLLVAEVRGWIVAHLGEDIHLAQLSARFNVSGRTLVRRFQRAMNMTPVGFVKLARIDAAQSMMRRTRYSVEQIAHLVGYRDMGVFREAFREAFREHTGSTPRVYRMQQSVAFARDDALAEEDAG